MVLLGFGGGIAFNPVLLAAMEDVDPEESGLASGAVNTAFMMGGALGLAVLASIAASASSGDSSPSGLLTGYHVAFAVGAVLSVAAAVIGYVGLRERAADDADLELSALTGDEALASC
jgi:MFS family permease